MADKQVLEPAGEHIIVADRPRGTTIDGIELPDNVRQQEMVFGYVIFVGPDVKHTKVQDTVCYGPYAGKNVVLEGVEFRIMKEGQIEAYIRTKAEPKKKRFGWFWDGIKKLFTPEECAEM